MQPTTLRFSDVSLYVGKQFQMMSYALCLASQLIRLLRAGASLLEKRRESGHRPEIPSGLLKPEPKAEEEEEEEQVRISNNHFHIPHTKKPLIFCLCE